MIGQSARATRIRSRSVRGASISRRTVLPPLGAQLLGAIPPYRQSWSRRPTDGLTATIGDETLRVSVCNASVIHVIATPKAPDLSRMTTPGYSIPNSLAPVRSSSSPRPMNCCPDDRHIEGGALAEARELEIQQHRRRVAAARKRCDPTYL